MIGNEEKCNRNRKVIEYHEGSKHHFEKYAPGPGYLDWASQPDPFRRYKGASIIPLKTAPFNLGPPYDAVFSMGSVPSEPLTPGTFSRLLLDSLSLTAWKQAGGERWALRANPSSGNLHPTESYIICGPVDGLIETPCVFHYAPREHALEIRAIFPISVWEELTTTLPPGTILFGLSSIHWREAWKYGVRAYRYCQLDIGHAIGAVALAASGLGRQTRLLDGLSRNQLAILLGINSTGEAEPEEPECMMAVYPYEAGEQPAFSLDPKVVARFESFSWKGIPNRLSPSRRDWPAIDRVVEAVAKPETMGVFDPAPAIPHLGIRTKANRPLPLRPVIHRRRSALAMDGVTSMSRSTFYDILLKIVPGVLSVPFTSLPWQPAVHLAIFLHRVDGLPRGIYFLVRNQTEREELRAAMHDDFIWKRPEGCPESLDLYLLATLDVERISKQVACGQDIAGDGCFSTGMVASFKKPLEHYGEWFYPRLFWECGLIGQVLYLEAEASNLRGTGIGCYFDDPVHHLLGLKDACYQDLYHFTIGGPVEDPRLTTLPPYPGVPA